jgi:hypothetical protein
MCIKPIVLTPANMNPEFSFRFPSSGRAFQSSQIFDALCIIFVRTAKKLNPMARTGNDDGKAFKMSRLSGFKVTGCEIGFSGIEGA